MSIVVHLFVLALLLLDLFLGSPIVARYIGRWAAVAFEFLLILGYVLFVIQPGLPWRRQNPDQ